MSHFSTLVIANCLSDVVAEIEATVSGLLEPYNENTEVGEYETDCGCIGRVAHKEAGEYADKEMGTIDSLRPKYWTYVGLMMTAEFGKWNEEKAVSQALPKKMQQRYNVLSSSKNWEKWLVGREDMRRAFFAAHVLKDKPIPDCPDCKGSGKTKTTYNPNSQWDWWEVGGRWDNFLQGQNIVRIADLKKPFYPFALITPDGEWHQKGEMGWFAMVSDEKSLYAWRKEVKKLLGQYKDKCYVGVLCDLHI